MSMNALLLLLTLTSTIVLRSGERIPVEGSVREERGVATFRSNGRLYSMPMSEVERIEKPEEAAKPAAETRPAPAQATKPRARTPLAVSEEERKRLLAELEKNHAGGPARELPIVRETPPPPSREEAREQQAEEQRWRSQARAHEENIRRATEELYLLETRIRELEDQIHSFITLGYKPRQFSYQTTQLERTREQLPYAKLEVTRAERAFNEFKEDARRQGILPGWLR
ncbi:MAG TPA: hypothetical protein VGF28_09240 [Thermoanaerobaculia bacterium]|jgi:hypothetical protein